MGTSQYTSGEYFDKHGDWHEEDSIWKAKNIFKIFSENNIKPKTIVDIGCGAGRIIHELSKLLPKDVKFAGFDISPQAIEIAQKYRCDNITIHCKDFFQYDTSNEEFDVLLLIDVFEHIEDYLGFLRKLRGKAKSYVFHIPLDMNVRAVMVDRQILSRNAYGHLHYFSKETSLITLQDSGYEIINWFYTAGSFEREEYKTVKSKVGNILRRILFKKFPDFTVRTLGGFSLIVLAK